MNDRSSSHDSERAPDPRPSMGSRRADHVRGLAEHTRRRRAQDLQHRFPLLAHWTVLDLGGTPAKWIDSPLRPTRVVTVSDTHQEVPLEMSGWLTHVVGSPVSPPAAVREDLFDLVVSHSTIEHFTGQAARESFALVVQYLGRHFWVETPNRHFPIEPHGGAPFQQFLPLAAQAWTHQHWPGTHRDRASRAVAIEAALSTELLCRTELTHLFPTACIISNRIGVFTASFTATDVHPHRTALHTDDQRRMHPSWTADTR